MSVSLRLREAAKWVGQHPAKAAAIVWLAPLPILLMSAALASVWNRGAASVAFGVFVAIFVGLIVYAGYRLWSRPTRLLIWILLVFTIGFAAWDIADRTGRPWWSWALDIALVVLLIMALRFRAPAEVTAQGT